MDQFARTNTRYARSGDVNIAYQVVGDGPFDLVLVPGFITCIDYQWEIPSYERVYRKLASFSRLILFDKRGTGSSDRISNDRMPSLEQRMDDVRAVMDAAGSGQAALVGISEGGPMSALFAATYPQRTRALVLFAAYARRLIDDDYPHGVSRGNRERKLAALLDQYGGPVELETRAPSVANDERYQNWWATLLRLGASPAAAAALVEMNLEIDIRPILPTIHVPTLVMHRAGDRAISVGNGRYLAAHIPDAKYVELAGDDHLFWVGDTAAWLNEIEEFLTGVAPKPDHDRILATVLFIDMVSSTQRASELGDARWRELLDNYYSAVRREIARFSGREIRTTGDGALAVFDGPARAIRCAEAVRRAVATMGIEIRAGVHTGECERVADQVEGIAVHIGARVAALAAASEVLVSRTVKDLVAGSGLRFSDHGVHSFKGVPEKWQLFSVLA